MLSLVLFCWMRVFAMTKVCVCCDKGEHTQGCVLLAELY